MSHASPYHGRHFDWTAFPFSNLNHLSSWTIFLKKLDLAVVMTRHITSAGHSSTKDLDTKMQKLFVRHVELALGDACRTMWLTQTYSAKKKKV